MSETIYSVITGTGSYIPTRRIKNEDFLKNEFYESDGIKIDKANEEIIDKFLEITTIAERRYVTDDLVTSDIAYFSALEAIKSANIDKEELDYIIVAHNFGDVTHDNKQVDIVPSLAARVKHKLEIKNPYTVAYDLPFGCPGWLQGVIQADYFIKSGDAKKVLVIGTDTLSRISDPNDRNSMIYADGAGATILEAKKSDRPIGILTHKTRSDTFIHSKMLYMGKSYKPDTENPDDIFLKMNGRKLYQYALENVPQTVKDCLDKCNTDLTEVNKVLIHQANGKMDDAMLLRLFKLYGIKDIPENVMPMTISWLGNSSVATIPTLLDLILKEKLEPHEINEGDTIVFTSVGAGMNINAMIYKV
ncbi:MAG: ketoacyl-ACP synthase III [Bacteroidetes bacterium]|nr:MAG: ketoacyl-ACP synthase III [Bacteroidota bacterium]